MLKKNFEYILEKNISDQNFFSDPDEPEYTHTCLIFHKDAEYQLRFLPGLIVPEIFRGPKRGGHFSISTIIYPINPNICIKIEL